MKKSTVNSKTPSRTSKPSKSPTSSKKSESSKQSDASKLSQYPKSPRIPRSHRSSFSRKKQVIQLESLSNSITDLYKNIDNISDSLQTLTQKLSSLDQEITQNHPEKFQNLHNSISSQTEEFHKIFENFKKSQNQKFTLLEENIKKSLREVDSKIIEKHSLVLKRFAKEKYSHGKGPLKNKREGKAFQNDLIGQIGNSQENSPKRIPIKIDKDLAKFEALKEKFDGMSSEFREIKSLTSKLS